MISSTANVAIPAASPDSRISGSPTTTAKRPPTRVATTRRGRVPDRMVAQNRKQVGKHSRLRLERDGQHAGGEGADCDEADLAEREHARSCRRRRRSRRRSRPRRARSGSGSRSSARRTSSRSRRGRRGVPARAASPTCRAVSYALHQRGLPAREEPGRPRSRTRITSANTTEGRKTVLSVGSAPLITPVAKPIAKPPSVAVQSRSIPPTTTPTSTTIVSFSAKSGETSGTGRSGSPRPSRRGSRRAARRRR